MEQVRCPFCFAFVVLDDATRTIRHAAPMCEAFLKKMESFGLKAHREPWSAVIINPK